MALPKPVRSADGVAPRHSAGTKEGEARISRKAIRREWWPDCCTRVLRRSIGCSKTAERVPEPRPATKWYAVEEKKLWSALCVVAVRSVCAPRAAHSTWFWPWYGHRCSFRSLFTEAERKCSSCREDCTTHQKTGIALMTQHVWPAPLVKFCKGFALRSTIKTKSKGNAFCNSRQSS